MSLKLNNSKTQKLNNSKTLELKEHEHKRHNIRLWWHT